MFRPFFIQLSVCTRTFPTSVFQVLYSGYAVYLKYLSLSSVMGGVELEEYVLPSEKGTGGRPDGLLRGRNRYLYCYDCPSIWVP